MKNKGFTLLEILVALFVFSILSLILSSGLRSVIDAQAGTERNAERTSRLQLALLLIVRDVEQAVDRPIWNAAGKEEPAFQGDARGFAFTYTGFANPTGTLLRSNLTRIAYLWQDEAIWRSTWPALDQAPNAKPHLRRLLDHVSARFQYLDKDGRFHAEWPVEGQSQALPSAVSIELTFTQWGTIKQLYVIAAQSNKTLPPTPPAPPPSPKV